jgi:hypothetical protein
MKAIKTLVKRRVWTAEEITALLAMYRTMLDYELAGERYSKAAMVRALMLEIDRTRGSIEAKCMNVSGVLVDAGRPYVAGYKPLGNCQALLRDMVLATLEGAS